ncbi:MAG: rhomboid family intramembrane serine protease [Burkholderiaceae bacterium]|jgi:membrane associated rhomboid family serine protease|nr:rhomboid family intramembrane serine protease [Burkholderiaceae bacterium]
MFLAIPLQHKPSWNALPWVTILLILVNCTIYFGWQVPEEKAVERMAAFYVETPLPEIEGTAYAGYLRERAERSGKRRDDMRAEMIERVVQRKNWPMLYEAMWDDDGFRARLLAGQIIGPDNPEADAWREARASFTPHEPQPFTTRWALSFEEGAPTRLVTWLTAAFLHGSFIHLLGNMVFLFLFGFTLEAALGPLLYLACYLIGGIGASALETVAYAGMGNYGLGASGAIAALMSMYVVLYGLRRIRFFYMVLFYFNYARWPALAVLPAYIGVELYGHLRGGSNVGYMAHLGGLLTGALLMGSLKLVRTFEDPSEQAARRNAPSQAETGRAEELARLIAKARQFTSQLAFADAAKIWRQAARLAPRDGRVLGAWLNCARHDPASEDFHAAARRIFRLPAHDAPTRQLLHRAWRTYLETAKPSVRLGLAEMQALVRAFAVQQEWNDADGLARALARINPPPEGWAETVQQLAANLARAGRMEEARAWLPQLQRHAPGGELTRLLVKGSGT